MCWSTRGQCYVELSRTRVRLAGEHFMADYFSLFVKRKRQGEASSYPGLGGGRGSQAHKPPSLPGLVSAALGHCWAGHFGAQVLLWGPDSRPDPHGGPLWLTAPVCLSLPTGISAPTLGTVVPWWHLPESSAEKLLHCLHLGLTGQECQSFIKSLPWRGGGWDVPAPTASAGAAAVFVPRNATQHTWEQTRLVQYRGLPAPYCVSKRQPHSQSVPFMGQ